MLHPAIAAWVEPRAAGSGKKRCAPALLAAVLVCGAVVAGSSSAAGARPAAACATTIKLGFGPYLEKEPPSANFELRGVIHPACRKAPRGKCVGEVRKGGRWSAFSTVAVLPASGRCRFILSSSDTFAPTTARVRYLPAAGFAPSSGTIVMRDDATGPFPPDLGSEGTSQPGQSSGNSGSGATKIDGIVFLDTAQSNGGPATIPSGATIYPPGSTVTGSASCQTTPTNGQLYLVFDYSGAPIAGEVYLTAPTSAGPSFEHAPIGLDVNAGRTVQFLGVPLPVNGVYSLSLHLQGLHPQVLKATFTLALSC